MIRLSRTVRFTIPGNPSATAGPPRNGFGGKPAMQGLGRYYELTVRCAGEPDAQTGYLVNIKEIDKATHAVVVPVITAACAERPETDAHALLPEIVSALDGSLPASIESVVWKLTPHCSVEMETDMPDQAIIRQRFDFAAAHRLNCGELSEEENRRIFGRCNHPSGHGHNYMVEPAIALELGNSSFSSEDIERIVAETVIDPFDHTNLDEDHEAFSTTGNGLTSSVEHIARVFYELLSPEIERASNGTATLRSMTVWETDRTSATYPG
ncbi:MAG: 6-carboxytetrahydropterin synthase [Planctomycetota bacterium]